MRSARADGRDLGGRLGCWCPAAGIWLDGAAAAVCCSASRCCVFAIGECLHGAVQGPLVADLAEPRLIGPLHGAVGAVVADRLHARPCASAASRSQHGAERRSGSAPRRRPAARRPSPRSRSSGRSRSSRDAARATRIPSFAGVAEYDADVTPIAEDPLSTDAEPAPHPQDAAARRPETSLAHGLTLARARRRRPDLGPPRRARTPRRRRARRALRLAPARRRGRALEAPAAEDRRLRGGALPLRRPPLPRLRQGDPAAERGRARRLPRPRLPRHAAERRAAAGRRASSAAARRTRSSASSCSRRAPAGCSTRCSTTSSTTASRSSTRSATSSTAVEDDMFEGRAEEVVRDISNVKQEIISYRKIIKPERADAARCSSGASSGSCPRSSTSTSTTSSTPPSASGTCSTTTRRSSRRSSRTNESVISHRQNDVLRAADGLQRDDAAADADHRHLRHERRSSRARARARRSG